MTDILAEAQNQGRESEYTELWQTMILPLQGIEDLASYLFERSEEK